MSSVCIFAPTYNVGNRLVLAAFATGFGSAPVRVRDDSEYVDCDIMVIFGMVKKAFAKSFAKAKLIERHGDRPFIVIERGFVHRGNAVIKSDDYLENTFWSVGYGGINGHADFRSDGVPIDRWNMLGVDLMPWRKNVKGCALLVGQVPWDVSVQDTGHVDWLKRKVAELRSIGMKVLFRPHPFATHRKFDYGISSEMSSSNCLVDDFERVDCAVTWNSNVGVDAVISGIPVIVEGEGSMAASMASKSVNELSYPDRNQWAASLAYSQWTMEEMRAGKPQSHLALI